MYIIAYIIVGIASLVMVWFGYQQSQSQFYMCVFSAAVIYYCIYLDFKKRREKKEEEEIKSGSKKTITNSKKTKDTVNISQNAHKKVPKKK